MKWLFFILLMLCLSCGSDDLSNTRAYAEGKVVSESFAMNDLDIFIISNTKVVAQTKPTASGSFVLSGPMFSDGFDLKFNRKIASFSASKEGCSLSQDSLSIVLPDEVSFISFEEIRLQE